MVAGPAFPASGCWLARARVPDRLLDVPQRDALAPAAPGFRAVQLRIQDGHITALAAAVANDGLPVVDLADGIVTPCWVDLHTHLDKSHTATRIGRTHHALRDAVAASGEDRDRWTVDDIRRRMDFSLRTAYTQGTRAIRTHIDWVGASMPQAWPVAQALRGEWSARVELQPTSLSPLQLFAQADAGTAIAAVLAKQGGVLGASVHPVPGQRSLLERVFELAVAHDLDLDFHADEHLQNDIEGLRTIARLTMRYGWEGRVACGHACALSVAPVDACASVLRALADAGIVLIGLPLANLQLQDGSAGRTPRLRGIAPLQEARDLGVRVGLASDNVQDAFVPFADFDLLQVLAVGALAAHLDDPLARWIDCIGTTPAAAMGLAWDGTLRVGAPADLVLLTGRNSFEVCGRPERRVLRGGRLIDAALPDFRELDRPGPAN
ncbi:amidohydrolase family protein [Hydrogenophaga sp. BPS33]|uniref:amidohydrolase family protein n=1 Tax=Hydrogenophaga sp. BPS33 TaxID=2651974 RepID=UPI00135A45BF|nr:amidohydrolase family protein [Hydrogenophaga sp. BPS33]